MYVMGIDPTLVRTSAEGTAFRPGTLGANASQPALYTAPMGTTGSTAGADTGPKVYVYVTSTAGVTANQVVLVSSVFDAVAATATNGATGTGAGKQVAVAKGTIAAGGSGWVQVYGNTPVLVVAATAPNTVVSLSGTAGALDDLTAVGTLPVLGVSLASVVSTTGQAFLNWPHIGPAITA
jgi:hypothetical protein